MPDELPIPERAPQGVGGHTRLIVALAAALIIGALAFVLMRDAPTPAPAAAESPSHTTTGPEERAYLGNIGVDHLEVSRAENFLHQEVTTISGQITNGGVRPLASVELTLEFYDQVGQVTQREVRALFGPPGPAIPAGDHREFEVSFEHISAMWSMRPPVAKITAIQFSAAK
jgi:hypothetical protein